MTPILCLSISIIALFIAVIAQMADNIWQKRYIHYLQSRNLELHDARWKLAADLACERMELKEFKAKHKNCYEDY